MGMILTGIVGAIVIAIGASYFLRAEGQDRPAWQVYSSSSVRVDDPGQNLVGPAWTGEADVGETEAVETDQSAG
jgi:hypothetical protein